VIDVALGAARFGVAGAQGPWQGWQVEIDGDEGWSARFGTVEGFLVAGAAGAGKKPRWGPHS